jgi:hypothetical protein
MRKIILMSMLCGAMCCYTSCTCFGARHEQREEFRVEVNRCCEDLFDGYTTLGLKERTERRYLAYDRVSALIKRNIAGAFPTSSFFPLIQPLFDPTYALFYDEFAELARSILGTGSNRDMTDQINQQTYSSIVGEALLRAALSLPRDELLGLQGVFEIINHLATFSRNELGAFFHSMDKLILQDSIFSFLSFPKVKTSAEDEQNATRFINEYRGILEKLGRINAEMERESVMEADRLGAAITHECNEAAAMREAEAATRHAEAAMREAEVATRRAAVERRKAETARREAETERRKAAEIAARREERFGSKLHQRDAGFQLPQRGAASSSPNCINPPLFPQRSELQASDDPSLPLEEAAPQKRWRCY